MTIEALIKTLKDQNLPAEDLDLVRRVYEFAARVHADQKRKSGEPYITHPLTTATRIAEIGLDTPTIVASLLHDVCEDSGHPIAEIRKEFGDEIAFLVDGVTKIDRIRYKGQERSAESIRKMFLAIAEDIRIVILKLTDRMHNMETLQYLPAEKQKRIALETLEIYAPLAYRLGMRELSGKLEDLAFPYVYPRECEWLLSTTREAYAEGNASLKKMQPILAEELQKEEIPYQKIYARVKRHYSLYKKLQKYDMDIEKITDVVALRVIVPTLEDCYATLGVVHKLWRPLPGKIKDYIALPKPNGYRSLHTTVFGADDRVAEIQIRTPEMDEEAEHGIAAHWAYREFKSDQPEAYAQRKVSFANRKETAWIEQLREWEKEFQKPDEFLESLKIDFFKNRIFVLTPKGDVVDLPENATPLDFAYHIHTDLGHTAVGAKVNGKMVGLDYLMKNGDIVEILTQKNRKPSADWLSVVKSPQAHKKIASALRKAEEQRVFEKKSGEIVELRITAQERIGLLQQILNLFTRQKIGIKNLITDTKHRAYPVIHLQAVFKNRRELEKIILKIKEIKGIREINYKLL